jgi:hypothetical protein
MSGLGGSGTLEVLDDLECLALLRLAPVGRLGLTVRTLPVILPVNMVVVGRDVVIATESGSVLSAAIAGDVACVEVDDHDPLSHEGWSVMVTGRLSEVSDPAELDELARLPLGPWRAMVDPHLVRLRMELLSGRRLTVVPVRRSNRRREAGPADAG